MSSVGPERKIIHVDMDAFYASVEQRDHPHLRGKPVVVGGPPDSRGVVASASYEARKSGVRSAMSSSKAYRLCPQAIFVSPNFSAYKEASRQIHEIFSSITPLVEPLSLDEAYLDVTTNALNEPIAKNIAAHIKARIKEETGLTASAGVGPNKFIAKLASDFKKPDGLVVVPPQKVLSFISPLPVERLWGVGPATATRLHELGLRTIAQIRELGKGSLEREFGKFGAFLYDLSHGIDDRPVESEWETKSRGSENTFDEDVTDLDVLRSMIDEQVADCCEWLKREETYARTVTLKVRYHDFKTVTRSRTLTLPSDHVEVFRRNAYELLTGSTEAGRNPIRLIGVSISGFLNRNDPHQLWFEFMESQSKGR
jgi:DNA polymerase-4